MRLQVVHCHPLTSSYSHALFRAIVETLETNGHEVVATDLYRPEECRRPHPLLPALVVLDARRSMKSMCAKGAKSFYLARYGLDRASDESRRKFIEKVKARVARLR